MCCFGWSEPCQFSRDGFYAGFENKFGQIFSTTERAITATGIITVIGFAGSQTGRNSQTGNSSTGNKTIAQGFQVSWQCKRF